MGCGGARALTSSGVYECGCDSNDFELVMVVCVCYTGRNCGEVVG